MNCRMCRSSDLAEFLDLGYTPPADRFLRRGQLREPEVHYPLVVLMCNECGLAQLSFVVPPDVLYQQDYPYESSTTETGRKHWAEFARTITERLGLGGEDLVLDIGSNVGVLLEEFRNNGTQILGLDPAGNIAEMARSRGTETINDFFSVDVAGDILRDKGAASVITATNVFAHVDDLDCFMQGIDALLSETGVFVFEAPYLLNLFKSLEYDTIYHEHL